MPIKGAKLTINKATKKSRPVKGVFQDRPRQSQLGGSPKFKFRSLPPDMLVELVEKRSLPKRVVKDSPLPSVLGKDRIREAVWGRYPEKI